MTMRFGLFIARLREERGWSQYELSTRTGIPRSTIASIEVGNHTPKVSGMLSFSKAFDIPVEELYEAAGFTDIEVPTPDTPEQLLEKLRLAQPVSIPVYDRFPIHAGEVHDTPIEYVYRPRSQLAGANIEAYRITGHCLEPLIADGDIAIVDRDRNPAPGNIVVALLKGDQLVVGRLKLHNDKAIIENNNECYNYDECHVVAVVIEVNRRLV